MHKCTHTDWVSSSLHIYYLWLCVHPLVTSTILSFFGLYMAEGKGVEKSIQNVIFCFCIYLLNHHKSQVVHYRYHWCLPVMADQQQQERLWSYICASNGTFSHRKILCALLYRHYYHTMVHLSKQKNLFLCSINIFVPSLLFISAQWYLFQVYSFALF